MHFTRISWGKIIPPPLLFDLIIFFKYLFWGKETYTIFWSWIKHYYLKTKNGHMKNLCWDKFRLNLLLFLVQYFFLLYICTISFMRGYLLKIFSIPITSSFFFLHFTFIYCLASKRSTTFLLRPLDFSLLISLSSSSDSWEYYVWELLPCFLWGSVESSFSEFLLFSLLISL